MWCSRHWNLYDRLLFCIASALVWKWGSIQKLFVKPESVCELRNRPDKSKTTRTMQTPFMTISPKNQCLSWHQSGSLYTTQTSACKVDIGDGPLPSPLTENLRKKCYIFFRLLTENTCFFGGIFPSSRLGVPWGTSPLRENPFAKKKYILELWLIDWVTRQDNDRTGAFAYIPSALSVNLSETSQDEIYEISWLADHLWSRLRAPRPASQHTTQSILLFLHKNFTRFHSTRLFN